jgi:hypothetical protein
MVLYEDLRLELIAASEDEMKPIDGTTINSRKQHFMRTAVGTTIEFAEEFRLLDESGDFQDIRSKFGSEHLAEWRRAVDFFAEHEPALERIRNDIGGHFGYSAALYAVQNLNPDAIGRIKVELNYGNHTGKIWYELAEEIAATAMERQKKKGETSEQFFARTFQLLSQCFEHAVRTTDLVSNYYTIGRFR